MRKIFYVGFLLLTVASCTDNNPSGKSFKKDVTDKVQVI